MVLRPDFFLLYDLQDFFSSDLGGEGARGDWSFSELLFSELFLISPEKTVKLVR